ncbi:hypothetical protein PLESTB_000467600 [Pleodorina starrii]|uniref:Uncharacterized protein n=1 Tax=Pleodorina starrii TaxID=330485 RepID=A0A9W6EZT9_9CHLO|nr:hypothetical protein PLESTM_001599200 [Pleodorina starrii]GLC51117.1 hypothetical protein PLESTB_000467600 [Pleodorina starrii]
MGKSKGKGKRKKSEFDDFFEKKDDGWVSGVSAMALDGEPASAPTSTAAGEIADMEVGDAPSAKGGKGTSLGVQKISMKAVRGQRTKAQKFRKGKQAEKATARAEKAVVRIGAKTAHKQKKNSLKTIY